MLKLSCKISSFSIVSLLATTPLMAMDVDKGTERIHPGRRAPTPSVEGSSGHGRTTAPLPSESSFRSIDEDVSIEQGLDGLLNYVRQNPTLVDELIGIIEESQTNVNWKQLSRHVLMLSIVIALKATSTI